MRNMTGSSTPQQTPFSGSHFPTHESSSIYKTARPCGDQLWHWCDAQKDLRPQHLRGWNLVRERGVLGNEALDNGLV
jgi:hypothetical protein